MKTNDMVFPVLAIKGKEPHFYGFADKNSLVRSSVELVNNKRVFDNTFFIDALGNKYLVQKVNFKRWGTIFWGYSLFLKGRQIVIDFDLDFVETVKFEIFREYLLERIKSKRSYLKDEKIELLLKAENFRELIKIFF